MTTASARPRALITEPDAFDPAARDLLAERVEVVPATRTMAPAEWFRDFEVVWIRLGLRISADLIGDTPRCRILACPATGLDHIDLDACTAQGIRVVSLKGETAFLRNVRATAELTVALLLNLYRSIPAAAAAVLGGEWNRERFRGREIAGKTVGLVGVGRLGCLVADMLTGFDVDLVGYDKRDSWPAKQVRRMESLASLLETSDVVSVHVTYDDSTHHLIGTPELERMRPDAVLINTSRGGVVDERALLSSLERNAIAGAALDVLQGEPHPLLDRHPLLAYARAHSNLLIVPHIGGNTRESAAKTDFFIARRVLEALGYGATS